MSRRRTIPPAPGVYCDVTTARDEALCNDPAVFLVFWADKKTGEPKQENACGAHLGRLVQLRADLAEYSREMFRVLPWEMVMANSADNT